MTSLKVAGEGSLQAAGLDLSTEEALETLGKWLLFSTSPTGTKTQFVCALSDFNTQNELLTY